MHTTTYNSKESGTSDYAYTTTVKALIERFQGFKRGFQLKLASSSAGRIALHLTLAVVTCHFAWHFHGIARELTRS